MNSKVIVPVVILLVAGMVFYMNLTPPLPEGYVDFRAVELQSEMAKTKDVRILDVRTPGEFNGGHIPGAKNLDYHGRGFDAALQGLEKDAQYLIYCTTGSRSASTVKRMSELGFTKVWHLSRGIVDWMGEQLPLVR